MTSTQTTTTRTEDITVTARGYTATIDTAGRVDLTDVEGRWAGTGKWDPDLGIVDCAAALGADASASERIYAELDEAIEEALEE